MKSKGKTFEDNWKDSYKGLITYHLRLKDSAKWLVSEESSFQTSNPCDFIQFKSPYLWMLELKSTEGSSISFNGSKPWEKPEKTTTNYMIKPSQVKELMKYSKYDHVICGLVLNYRERALKTSVIQHQTYYVDINAFVDFASVAGKSSISALDCAQIGIKIDHRLKQVNYEYNIEKLINEVTGC